MENTKDIESGNEAPVGVEAIVRRIIGGRIERIKTARINYVRACCKYHSFYLGGVYTADGVIPGRYFWGVKVAETAEQYNAVKFWFMKRMKAYIGGA